MKMKVLLSLALIVITLISVSSTVFAAEIETETDSAVTGQQQNETKPSFPFGKDFKHNGVKKPATLPEGVQKPDMSKIKENGFANFKKLDKEAIREKLDALLAEGKITQEKYDAIISGECKPSFYGKKFPIFQNKKTDAENETTDESTVKTRPAFGKRTGGKFPAMKKGFKFAGAKG